MNGRTILVAEDNGAIRGLVARVLGCEGYRVLQAADGLEAWSVCEQRGYEIALVITDMVMPRMDGAELCRLIHQRWPRMGTLLMTGSAEGLLLDGALRGRFVRLLRKPFRPTELLTAARQALYDNALAPERGDSVRSAGPARPCSESASALTEICCVS